LYYYSIIILSDSEGKIRVKTTLVVDLRSVSEKFGNIRGTFPARAWLNQWTENNNSMDGHIKSKTTTELASEYTLHVCVNKF